MVLKSRENNLGAWAFLVGVVLAVIVGVFTTLIQIPYLIKYSANLRTFSFHRNNCWKFYKS